MITVEGLDNTGKTTLVERIAEEFPSLEMRPSIGNKHDPAKITEMAYSEAYALGPRVISDRVRLISEYVYNPVLNKRPIAYGYNRWLSYLGAWSLKKQLVIYCHREPIKILDSFNETEQLEGVEDNLLVLDMRYKQMMHTLEFLFAVTPNPDNLIIDWDFDDYENTDYILEAVKLYLKGV